VATNKEPYAPTFTKALIEGRGAHNLVIYQKLGRKAEKNIN